MMKTLLGIPSKMKLFMASLIINPLAWIIISPVSMQYSYNIAVTILGSHDHGSRDINIRQQFSLPTDIVLTDSKVQSTYMKNFGLILFTLIFSSDLLLSINPPTTDSLTPHDPVPANTLTKPPRSNDLLFP
jgi:hypothetical protein